MSSRMTPQLITLFGELAGLSPEQRQRYYSAHGTAEELRREVESLLAYDGGPSMDGIVETAVGLAFRETASDGDWCGPFRLLRQIGRGGMGIVYLAERADGEVRQRVAVKLLRSTFDSSTARQRFLQERQILAHLSHPHIAKLIDAGHRPDGHPYLAMEYVEGRPIDEFAASLSMREKVALLVPVCAAIAAAHQKLVVHRDLKPGNILVEEDGRPVVLDFGIAKLMDVSDATATMERRLTPEYASPEQKAGAPASTAADIYSLGAVLHQVLTGNVPQRDTDPAQIRETTGDRDLDAVISKATRTEPDERYSTADQLAQDLRAWLDGRPVAARQGERWYRARRYLRRYWPLVLTAACILLGLTAGLVVIRRERDAAQQRFEEVRRLANEFFAVEKDIQGVPGSTAIRERMVKTSIRYLEGLSRAAGDNWRLKQEIAAGYRKAAEAQGLTGGINLGHPADAQQSLNRAAMLLQQARAVAPNDRSVRHDLIELTELQARLEFGARNLKALEVKLHELQDLFADYERGSQNGVADWKFAGGIYERMALQSKELGDPALPMQFAQRAVELHRKVVAVDRSFPARGGFGNSLAAYGGMLRACGDVSGAADAFFEALGVFQSMVAEKPDDYKAQLNLANVHASYARTIGDPVGPSLSQTQRALPHFEECLRIGRRLMAQDANDQQIRFNHAVAAWRMGDALRPTDLQRALASYDESIGVVRPMPAGRFGRDIPLIAALSESAQALLAMGRVREAERRTAEAGQLCSHYQSGTIEVYETCRVYASRAEAALALQAHRPAQAITAIEGWLHLVDTPKNWDLSRKDLHAAYELARHYHLLRDAQIAAGLREEAAATERKRRELGAVWKAKLSAKNPVDVVLLR